MRGGMRCGAGRPGWKRLTSAIPQVDVRALQRDGHLSESRRLMMQWANGGGAHVHTARDVVTLVYRYRGGGGDWRDVTQPVRIARTPCNFGGERPWFVCPICCRRVATLYLWGPPACRTCKRLAYPVQSLDGIGRSWRRSCKIARRLGSNDAASLPRRPKGMHQATYARLMAALWREEECREAALAEFVQRMGAYL